MSFYLHHSKFTPYMIRKSIIALVVVLLFTPVLQAQEAEKTKSDSTKKEKKKQDLPLEVARRVPIKTNEGTWMSLDVSPDGKTIAFDFMGDIFTMPITGGKPVPFTSKV